MDDAVISRHDAKGQLYRLKGKSLQWRKSQYRDGWNDALESADSALNNCRELEVKTVVCCGNCFHATDRDKTLVYCSIQRRHKKPDAYCDEGTPLNEY